MKYFYMATHMLASLFSLLFFFASIWDMLAGNSFAVLWLGCLAVTVCISLHCLNKWDEIVHGWKIK